MGIFSTYVGTGMALQDQETWANAKAIRANTQAEEASRKKAKLIQGTVLGHSQIWGQISQEGQAFWDQELTSSRYNRKGRSVLWACLFGLITTAIPIPVLGTAIGVVIGVLLGEFLTFRKDRDKINAMFLEQGYDVPLLMSDLANDQAMVAAREEHFRVNSMFGK